MPSIESSRQAAQDAIKSGQLVRASTPAVNPAPPTPPLTDTNSLNRFLDSPLPANYTQQPDQQRQWQRGGVVPQERVPPLPPAANAQIGATSQSQATIVVAQTPPSTGTGGGITSASLTVPSFLTVTGSPITPPSGTFAVGLATELPGTYFGVPSGAGLGALEAFNISSNLTGAGGSGAVTVTSTPSTATSWALLPIVTKNGYAGAGLGAWTGLTGNDGIKGTFIKNITGTSPVSVSEPLIANDTATLALAIFSGPLPTIVQQNTASSYTGQTMSKAYGSSNTAGNTLFIVFQYTLSSVAFGMSASDTAGNSYVTLASTFGGNTAIGATGQLVMVAPSCLGGANTVNVQVTGGSGGTPAGLLQIFEIAPIAAGPGVPFFHPLFPGDIPPINLSSVGNGGIQNILGLPNGGTKSDLSGTGGPHQFVSQASSGAAFTVVQPDFSDLAGAAGQLATKYNGISTVSKGIPAEYATIDLTAQAANIGATTLYAVPASGVGVYRVSSYIVMTTPASATSTLPTVQIVYTDNDSNVSVTMDATPVSGTAGLGQTGALNTNAAGSAASGVIAVYVKASTTIQYQTINYASTAAGMLYALRIKLEAL